MLLQNKNHRSEDYFFKTEKGLNQQIVTQISEQKNEPGWMTDFRLKALEIFEQKPMPHWGADLSGLDPYDIFYYVKPIEGQHTQWSDVPEKMRRTFEKLGIPQAEQQFLAGVGAQFESEIIYKNLKKNGRTKVSYLWTLVLLCVSMKILLKNIFLPLFHLKTINLQH